MTYESFPKPKRRLRDTGFPCIALPVVWFSFSPRLDLLETRQLMNHVSMLAGPWRELPYLHFTLAYFLELLLTYEIKVPISYMPKCQLTCFVPCLRYLIFSLVHTYGTFVATIREAYGLGRFHGIILAVKGMATYSYPQTPLDARLATPILTGRNNMTTDVHTYMPQGLMNARCLQDVICSSCHVEIIFLPLKIRKRKLQG